MDTDVTRRALESAVVEGMARAERSVMQYGVDDCALWVANIQCDVLGYDPAAHVRGRYKSRYGALRVTGAAGLLGQLKRIARRHQWKRIDPSLAQPGDTGLAWTFVSGKAVLATVICRASGWFVGRNEGGFTALRADKVTVAWSVLDDAKSAAVGGRINLRHIPLRPDMCPTSAVRQEPISLFILSTIGIAATSTAVAITSFIVGTALSIGVSLVASLLRPQAGASLDQNMANAQSVQAVQITERQPIPIKRVIVGSAYVGGALCFEKVTPPHLTMGVLFNYGEVTAVDKVYIGTNELSFAAITPSTILTPIAVDGQPNYPAKLRMSLRYGSMAQAVDPLVRVNHFLPIIDRLAGTPIGNMTSGDGIASVYDGNPNKAYPSCAIVSATGNGTALLGKDWGTGVSKIVGKFSFTATNSLSLADSPVTVTLEGSTDNFASSVVSLYTNSTPTIYAASSTTTVNSGINISTAYRYHRLKFVETAGDGSSHTMRIAQVQFGEETGQNFRQAGNATAFYEFGFGADQAEFIELWGQVSRPNCYLVVRGVRCYDPRDPTQLLADETTWKWSNNATLVQAFYLTRSWGGRISTSKIRWDKIATSADYDDELIGCNDGTMIKRHTIDGVITLNQRPFDVMQDLLAANRAMVLESGGMMWIESSKPKTSIATIHDRILASGIKYQAARAKSQLVNKLQVRFVSPDQEYQLADGPILDRTDLRATDGEVLPATLALKYTQDHRRAQRLQKLFLLSSRLGRTITCSVDIALMAIAADELIGSVVTMDSELFSKANGFYLVTAVGFSDDCTTLSLALTEYDPTLESQWNPETDEQPFELSLAA